MNSFDEFTTDRTKRRLNFWIVIAVVMMLSNLILTIICWKAFNSRTIEITPFIGGESYTRSGSGVGESYIRMMSENFINLRLDVTPENIKKNHARILPYIDSRARGDFTQSLLKEQHQIIHNKISSYFDIDDVAVDAANFKAVIKGELKRFVGTRALKSVYQTYGIQYSYVNRRLHIVGFKKLKEKS